MFVFFSVLPFLFLVNMRKFEYTDDMPGSEISIMFYYTYILKGLKTADLYIGFTQDLVKRVKEHNGGLVESTRRYLPWRLIYYEACLNKEDAKRREHYFKTSQGKRLLKRRLKEYYYHN